MDIINMTTSILLVFALFAVAPNNAWLPPDVVIEEKMLVPEIITKHGYPVEVHDVITEDGYVLTMHRIPQGVKVKNETKKGAVLVMHGVLASSADWIICGPENGLGYILADEGYDVWLGNARGNRYSRNHTSLDVNSKEFWDFSWHEIGIHDLPQMIDYVIQSTGEQKIHYVAHSQGTTVFYVMASLRREYQKKIRMHIGMAPIAYVGHIKSPVLKLLSIGEGFTEKILQTIGINEFLPTDGFVSKAGDLVCAHQELAKYVCSNILFLICGFDYKQLNETTLPLIMHHIPAGSSTKQLLHYGQEIHSDKFRQYDYGFIGNKRKYGTFRPPTYNLRNIDSVPIYLFHSKNDWVSSERDVLRLGRELRSLKGKFLVGDRNFNHLDYLYGMNAPVMVYNKIISLMLRH